MEGQISEIAATPTPINGELKKIRGAYTLLYEILRTSGVRASDVRRLGEAFDPKCKKHADENLDGIWLACQTFLTEKKDPSVQPRPDTGLPKSVFDNIPDLLLAICEYMSEGDKRDITLLSMIGALSAALPNTFIHYGTFDLPLNIMLYIIGRTGGGKGVARHGVRLVKDIDEKIHEAWKEEYSVWLASKTKYDRKVQKSESPESDYPGSEPKERMLLAGATTTSAALAAMLENNELLITATEARELTASNSSQFGQFTHILLNSFHGESLQVDRRSQHTIRIKEPRLSVILTSTGSSFKEFMRGATEDGLLSRFPVFACSDRPEYESQRPQPGRQEFETAIGFAAERTSLIYDQLKSRSDRLEISATDEVWQLLDEQIGRRYDSCVNDFAFDLLSIVQRAAITALRIAAICAIWRAFERDTNLTTASGIIITEKDWIVGYGISSTCLDHAYKEAKLLVGGGVGLSADQHSFLDSLPDSFETAEAEEIKEKLGKSRSTIHSWLKKLTRVGAIEKVGHGLYRKN